MTRRVRVALAALTATSLLSGCSLLGADNDDEDQDPGSESSSSSTSPSEGASRGSGPVVLATHESFNLPKKLQRAFEQETGYTLEVQGVGDAGTLATKLSLSAENPIADAVFGIDNTFASRPIEAGALASYEPELPVGAEQFALPEDADKLTPIDNANVCINYDKAWFEDEGMAPPETLDQLAEPEYAKLLVTPGAATSSVGMSFFLRSVAEYDADWQGFWEKLVKGGAKVVDGWEDAYYGDFTAGAKNGTRPLVVSYDSSPAFTVSKGESTTAAVLDTCFAQVEYAGVLEGADNPEGAQALIDFLLTDEVQSALPEAMYVFPVSDTATIPDDWASFAVQPEEPTTLDPAEIDANREQWLTEWSDVVSR